jgi:hypothetical protein
MVRGLSNESIRDKSKMVSTTNYTAFGYVINRAELQPGDSTKHRTKKYVGGEWYLIDKDYNPNLTREDYLSGNYAYNEIALHVSGNVAVTPVHTMTPTYYTRGHCTIDCTYVKGMVREEVIEPTVVFGIDPFANIDRDPVLPDVSVLRWSVGSIIEPPVRFFLADGSFKKGNTTFSTVGAYSLSSGNIEITSDCLGFVFN